MGNPNKKPRDSRTRRLDSDGGGTPIVVPQPEQALAQDAGVYETLRMPDGEKTSGLKDTLLTYFRNPIFRY